MRHVRWFSLVALGVLGACSADGAPAENVEGPQQRVFSEDDRRVARALSVGRNDLSTSLSPQFRATLCGLALEAIEERMQGALSAEQQQAFAQAQTLYRQRATAGLSREERRRTISEVEASYPDDGERARFAISCLQDLT